MSGQTPAREGMNDGGEIPVSATLSNGNAEHASESSSQASVQHEFGPQDEDMIETMIRAREEDMDEARSLEHYRGSFAGLSLLQRVQNLCRCLSGMPRSPAAEDVEDDFVHAFDFTPPRLWSTIWDTFPLLPPPEDLNHAIDVVVNQACSNMQFLDSPSLRSIARRVYAEAETESRDHSGKSLALLYAVLALARRFEADPSNTSTSTGQDARNG